MEDFQLKIDEFQIKTDTVISSENKASDTGRNENMLIAENKELLQEENIPINGNANNLEDLGVPAVVDDVEACEEDPMAVTTLEYIDFEERDMHNKIAQTFSECRRNIMGIIHDYKRGVRATSKKVGKQNCDDLLPKELEQLKMENSELRVEITNLRNANESLAIDLRNVRNINYQLTAETKALDAKYGQLTDENRALKKQLSQQKSTEEENVKLRNRNKDLYADYDKLSIDNINLKNQNDSLQKRYDDLLQEITRLKTGGDKIRPQHHNLHRSFRDLYEQGFRTISKSIFEYWNRNEYKYDTKNDEKKKMIEIRAYLAKVSFQSIMKQLENGETINDNIINDICNSIHTNIRMHYKFNFPYMLKDSLQELVVKTFEFVRDMNNAFPPGELWFAEEGLIFDPTRHQILSGCKENGRISFTVYPGYSIYNQDSKTERIFEKALVFTSLDN